MNIRIKELFKSDDQKINVISRKDISELNKIQETAENR